MDGRLMLLGEVELTSPAIIGSGEGENTDLDVLIGGDGKPFIPATSFVGVLRHLIGDNNKEFWGHTEEDDSKQSDLICSELVSKKNISISTRDGIKIDNKKGIVWFDKSRSSGGKFDYQIVDMGAKFSLKIEVSYINSRKQEYIRILNTIAYLLENEKISVGAKTNNGFGKLKSRIIQMYDYDYNNISNVLKWLKNERPAQTPFNFNDIVNIDKNRFTITSKFILKNSLIIRSYPQKPDAPDAVNIKSNGKNIIPGTSIKGAIRSRAERIINTLGKSRKIIDDLFGYVTEDQRGSRKGKIKVEETILPDLPEEIQTRIKIDRFTGGTIESALFETEPIFSDNDKSKLISIKIMIDNFKPFEAGLMLLVLKDLFLGDLAIGGEKNIGRGVFEGVEATIEWDNQKVDISRDNLSGLSKLQQFVGDLKDYREDSDA